MDASEQARIKRRKEQSMMAQQAFRNRKLQISAFHEEEAASHTHEEGFSLYAKAALLRAKAAELSRSIKPHDEMASSHAWAQTRRESVMRELAVVESAINDLEKGFTNLDPVSLASVLERTPTEIIIEIFRWTLSPELRKFSRTVNGSHALNAPWPLAHICRAWRNAALGDPWLWSHIRIDARAPFVDFRSAYPMEALESQIQLSSSTLLQVDFRVDESTAANNIDHCVALLSAIADHSDRWTHLTLLWGQNTSIPRGLSRVRGRLGNLANVSLDYGDPYGPRVWPQELSDIFSIAPRLRKVENAHLHLFTQSSPTSGIWTRITHLELYANPELLLQAIKNVPNIAVVVFKEEFQTGERYTLTGIVTLPHLKRLSCLSHYSHILQHLAAPNLEDLHIMYCPCDRDIPEFLKLSECRLQNLKLGSFRDDADALGRLLECVPTLIHLNVIWDRFVNSERLPRIVVRVVHRAMGLCPRLTSLWVARPDDYLKKQVMEFETSLCEVIESRWNMPASERSLRSIRIPSIIHSLDVRERFETMKMAGLNINDQGEPVPHISEEEYEEYVA
ncbi:hypothetical protein R3P38DRAFT_2761156 [Favolaschia claudopus]|uniref:F-box domain-containing protein n=1 Tax=Favolaschia claudopus TaxID=2862362 RepID=A0AAW0DWJ4_9AGAR